MPGCLYRRLPPKDDSADAPAPQAPSRQSERIWLYQGHCLRSTFSICEGSALENRLRRSPCASSVLEQVRDGIRLKRGFGCGSAMSIKQVCCHCSRLSLSLIASKTGCVSAMQNRASSTFTIFDCIEDRMRLGHAKSSKLLLHGSRLSLSLARRRLAAPNHLRLSHARDGSLAWTSARTGFGRVPDSKPLLPCTRIPPPSSRTQPRFAAPRKQGKDCKT